MHNHKSLDELQFQPIPSLTMELTSEKSMFNVVTTLAPPFLIRSSSFLQVTRFAIKFWMVLKLHKIGPGTGVLAALEGQEKFPL